MYPTERTLLRHAIDRWTTHNPQSADALYRSAGAESVIFAISLRSLLQFNLTTKLFTPPPPLLTQYLGFFKKLTPLLVEKQQKNTHSHRLLLNRTDGVDLTISLQQQQQYKLYLHDYN